MSFRRFTAPIAAPLFVFMPGAGGRPKDYQLAQQAAARLGLGS